MTQPATSTAAAQISSVYVSVGPLFSTEYTYFDSKVKNLAATAISPANHSTDSPTANKFGRSLPGNTFYGSTAWSPGSSNRKRRSQSSIFTHAIFTRKLCHLQPLFGCRPRLYDPSETSRLAPALRWDLYDVVSGICPLSLMTA